MGAELDALCVSLAERDQLAGRRRALAALEGKLPELLAATRAVAALAPEHDRLQSGRKALEALREQVCCDCNDTERELWNLAKEHRDPASIARLSETVERLRSDSEALAAELARFKECEQYLKAEGEALRRAYERLDVLRAKAASAQSVLVRAVQSRTSDELQAVQRRRDRERTLFDRACADLRLRGKLHEAALKTHAATAWVYREQSLQTERLRLSLPEGWRPSATADAAEFAQLLGALAAARSHAAAVVKQKETLTAQAAEIALELEAADALYQSHIGDVAESRRPELERTLAALAAPLAACGLHPVPPADAYESLVDWCAALVAWCRKTRAAVAQSSAATSARRRVVDGDVERILRAAGADGVNSLAKRYLTESAKAERQGDRSREG